MKADLLQTQWLQNSQQNLTFWKPVDIILKINTLQDKILSPKV